MVQVLITHATSQRNRLSIRMRGLLPRKTSEHNYPTYDNQPQGVFGRWLGDQAWWGAIDGTRDVYLVDIAGLPTTHDEILPDAVVVTERIPPNRIVARVDDVPEYTPTKQYPGMLPPLPPPSPNFLMDIDLPPFLMDDTKEF